ncbi:hypothetical protein [Methylomagnum ishizawai]|uniref:hypothetical protein n=1 Tax=Methylomagnum ishizawai TaxID=1760988 RepID=UPI000F738C45|nr:hypothetical protein [Methylomagnum ishizawai]
MTRESQKIKEREHLEKAFNLLKIKYDVLYDKPEPPDFIISVDNKTIGLEITEKYRKLDLEKQSKELQSSIDMFPS